jgi:Putative zinc-finger
VSCQQIRDLFSARVDGALADAERARLDAHLATCAECAREWEGFERTVGLLRAVAPARAPAGFVDRVLAARPRPWYQRLARRLFVPWPVKLPVEAAAIVLIGGLAVLVFQQSSELQQAARAPAPPSVVSAPPTGTSPSERAPSRREAPESVVEKERTRATTSRGTPSAAAPRPDAAGSRDAPPSSPAEPPGQEARSANAPRAFHDLGPTASRDAAESPPAERSSPTDAREKRAVADPPARQEAAAERARALARQAAPAKPGDVQRLAAALDVQARLGVAELGAAERAVRDLVARTGGRVLSRTEDEGAIVLGLTVPGERWEEMRRGLDTLGALRLEGRGPDAGTPVRLSLRLER